MTTPKDIEAAEKLRRQLADEIAPFNQDDPDLLYGLRRKANDPIAQALAAAREEGRSERLKPSETNEIDGQEYPSDALMRLVEKIMGVTEKECADDVETGAAAWEYATDILGHIKAAREEGREQIINFLKIRSDKLFNEEGGAVVAVVYNSVIREIGNHLTNSPEGESDE